MVRSTRKQTNNKVSHNGKIGLAGAMAIGIGGMVGGGIFAVLGEAVTLARGATPAAFLVAGVLAFLTSYSYSKLSVRYPSQGGTVVYIDKAFGNDLATGSINLILWLSYLVTMSLYAVAFGSYASTFFTGDKEPWLSHVLISAGIIVPVGINLISASFVSKSETIIVVIKLLLLVAVIIAGAGYVDTSKFNPEHWEAPGLIVVAGMVIFVAYEGFELISNSAEDVKNPKKTLPRAFIGSVVLVIVLYILISFITVGSLSDAQIETSKDYALAEAAKPAMGMIGFTIVAVSALLATFSAINATIYGNARLGYTLAINRELPEILKKKAWNQPVAGVLAVGILSLLMSNLMDLKSIAIISSAGFLLVFAVTNAAAVRLAKETGGNRWISLIAAIACLAALLSLLIYTYKSAPQSLWIFIAFVVLSVLFELIYSFFLKKTLKMNRK